MVAIADYVSAWARSPFAAHDGPPWHATRDAEALIAAALACLAEGFTRHGDVAIHNSATVEASAIVKPPAIIGPSAYVAATAYLRGGVWLDRGATVGPACELKTVWMFEGAKIAHLSFVGDSILGQGVNIEAGAIVANHRNELDDRRIRIRHGGGLIETDAEKFGALIGDGARIGANAVIAPGALVAPGTRLPRLAHLDQHPDAS